MSLPEWQHCCSGLSPAACGVHAIRDLTAFAPVLQDEELTVCQERHTVLIQKGSGVRIVPVRNDSAVGGQGCRVYMQSNVDVRMRMVPAVLINFVLKARFCLLAQMV